MLSFQQTKTVICDDFPSDDFNNILVQLQCPVTQVFYSGGLLSRIVSVTHPDYSRSVFFVSYGYVSRLSKIAIGPLARACKTFTRHLQNTSAYETCTESTRKWRVEQIGACLPRTAFHTI